MYVLDFQNDADIISASFEDFYRTTILAATGAPSSCLLNGPG